MGRLFIDIEHYLRMESRTPAAEGGFVLRSIRRARERTSWAQAGMMQNTQPF